VSTRWEREEFFISIAFSLVYKAQLFDINHCTLHLDYSYE